MDGMVGPALYGDVSQLGRVLGYQAKDQQKTAQARQGHVVAWNVKTIHE